MKKIMWGIAGLSLVGTAIALQFLPERVPMHFDLAGNIDRWGSKYENLVFPGVILLAALFWTLMIRYYEKKAERTAKEKDRAEAETNIRVLGIAGIAMSAMFTVMQAFLLCKIGREALSGASAPTVDMGKVACVLMGVVFIVLGNFMPKTRRNSAVGFRVSWSMYNDNTWRKSNRFGAFALMAAGVLTVVVAACMKSSFGAVMVSLGLLLLAALVTALYARRVYLRELEEEKGET